MIDDLIKRYLNGTIGYKESKEILIKNIIKKIAPLREKREKIKGDGDYVLGVLEEGAGRARERAAKKMELVRKFTGATFK